MRDPLSGFLDAQGLLTRLPRKAAAREAALDRLAQAFAPALAYSEPEVNALLADLHTFGDHALLRRELFEGRRLTRTPDGRVYHRLAGSQGPIALRALSQANDGPLVAGLLSGAADYVMLERGASPGPQDVGEIFGAPAAVAPSDVLVYALLDAERQPRGLMAVLRHYPTPDIWFIGTLLVDVRARGKGYGAAAATWIAAQAALAGARCLRLCVIEKNTRGRAFWERQGFAEIAETPRWPAGQLVHRRFLFEKPLDRNA